MLLRQNALFSQTLGIMPIKCDQQLHLWGSIQHCYGVVWGPFKTRHESRAVKLTLDSSVLGCLLMQSIQHCAEGGCPKSPFIPCCPRRQLVLCLAAWLGASEGRGLCWSPIPGGAAVVEKGWGCGSLNRIHRCMCKAPAKIAAPCLGCCFRHSAQELWLKTAGPSKSCQPGRAQHFSLQGFSWAGCVSCWVDGGWPDQQGQFLGSRERRNFYILQSRHFFIEGIFHINSPCLPHLLPQPVVGCGWGYQLCNISIYLL